MGSRGLDLAALIHDAMGSLGLDLAALVSRLFVRS